MMLHHLRAAWARKRALHRKVVSSRFGLEMSEPFISYLRATRSDLACLCIASSVSNSFLPLKEMALARLRGLCMRRISNWENAVSIPSNVAVWFGMADRRFM